MGSFGPGRRAALPLSGAATPASLPASPLEPLTGPTALTLDAAVLIDEHLFLIMVHEAPPVNDLPVDVEVFYPHPPARVWGALRHWLSAGEVSSHPAHQFSFPGEPWLSAQGMARCEVLEATPPHRLALLWPAGAGFAMTRLTFTLRGQAGGTVLRIERRPQPDTPAVEKLIERSLIMQQANDKMLTDTDRRTDAPPSRFFRLEVDEEALTDELFAFVTDPYPSRTERPVIDELHDLVPEMVDVLECMVIDGVDQRHHVADYVHAVFSEGPA